MENSELFEPGHKDLLPPEPLGYPFNDPLLQPASSGRGSFQDPLGAVDLSAIAVQDPDVEAVSAILLGQAPPDRVATESGSDPLAPQSGLWQSGFFTVGDTGQVGIDFLFDGGGYVGELAFFSMEGMEAFEPGSQTFIQEAARRALSDSLLGAVVISDAREGAKFRGSLPWERDLNAGKYQGVKTITLGSGDTFAAMLVPHGTVQKVFDNPGIGGKVRPLFSLAPANPLQGFHLGQIADVTGDGRTFVFEDLRFDGRSDRDYNDIIFQLTGATGTAIGLDAVIDPERDWRESDIGRQLAESSPPAIAVSDILVVEGDDGSAIAEFTVSLSKTSTQTVTVDFTTADGTAIAGLDYELISGTVSFAPGETSQTLLVPILGDTIDEPNEQFFLNLSSAVNAEITDNQGVATLVDDDAAPRVSISDVSVIEGDTGTVNAEFIVSLSHASTQTVAVDFTTADGTAIAGLDYEPISGTVSFAPGETSKTLLVPVRGDTVEESNEQFFLNLSTANYAEIADGQGVATIEEDADVPTIPTLLVSDVAVREGDEGITEARITVQLSDAIAQPVTVDFMTADGTARAGEDYEASRGTLTFNPGDPVSQTIVVPIIGDNTVELDETFSLNFANATNVRVPENPGIVTLLNDDSLSSEIVLREGDDFQVKAEIDLKVPATPSVLRFRYSDLFFDTTDPDFINDAFEVAFVDENGNSLVHTIGSQRDAFLNFSDGQPAALASGVAVEGQTVSLNLAGVPPGTPGKLIFRLLNNDSDTTTTIRIADIEIQAEQTQAPLGRAPVALRGEREAVNFSHLSDVSSSFQAKYHQTAFKEETQELSVEVALRNGGTYSINAPLVVAIDRLSDPSVEVINADGITPEGLPYYTFSPSSDPDRKIAPQELTGTQTLTFKNPNGVQFTYELVILAEVNANPAIESHPDLEVISGQTYQYDVDATDPDGDRLNYELVMAPPGMVIDPQSGNLTWDTTLNDTANHAVVVQVSDGRGGRAEQTYTLSVIAEPPNRPPIFTSTPIVDARINQPYTYDAEASDPDSDPLTYSLIRGPEGLQIDPNTGVVEWTPPPILALGDTVFGHIRLPGDGDEFTVSGVAGQRLFLDSLQGFSGWQIKLYSPSGREVNRENDLFTLTETGSYRIVVNASGEQTGSYGFSLIDPYLLPETPFDTVIKGQLGPGTEDDLFRFNGLAGQKLFFDHLNKTGNIDWVLLDAGNGVVASNSSMNDLELYVPTDGQYLLALRGRAGFTDVVDYTFEIVTPDETTQPLLLGSNDTPNSISGRISEPGEEDFFTFSGSIGQRVYLDRLNSANNSSLSFSLFSPSGNQVLGPQTFVSGHESAPITLTEAGIYRVRIDGAGDDVGEYRFSLRDVDAATSIDLDRLYSGTLAPGEASHLFQFEASEGQRLFLDYQDDSGTASHDRAKWVLYDSGNRQVDYDYTGQHIEVVLNHTGTYTLAIEGDREDVAVNYSFEVITPETITRSLPFDTPIADTIGEKGEQDVFIFEGTQGQRIFFDVLESSGHRVDLVTPSGQKLLDATVAGSEGSVFDQYLGPGNPLAQRRRGPFILPEDGTYHILFDGSEGTTGSYGFQVIDVSDAPPLPAETLISNTLNPGSSIQFYQFEGSEGDRVYLDNDTTSRNLVAHVYGPSSQLIRRLYPSQTDREIVLPGDGTYFLMLRGESNEPIDYTIQITSTPAASPAPDGVTIPIDFSEVINGNIAEAGQTNTYTFTGTENQQLIFDSLIQASNGNILSAEIYSPSGQRLVDYDFRGYDPQAFTLHENGTYRVVVDARDEQTASYSFQLLNFADATEVNLDTPFSGNLGDTKRKTHLYRFTGEKDQRVYFDRREGDFYNNYVLYAPDGHHLFSQRLDRDYDSVVLPADGEYVVAILGDGGSNSDYSMNLVTPDWLTTEHTIGETVSGEIGEPGEIDYYTFTGQPGQVLWFDSLLPSQNISATLHTPGGNQIWSESVGRDVFSDSIILGEAGTYTLAVDASRDITGEYAFRFLDFDEATASETDTDISGNFGTSGLEAHAYRFTGTEGEKLYFDRTSGSFDYYVYDPFGSQILWHQFNSDYEGFTLSQTGEYTLIVSGDGYSQNYEIEVVTPEIVSTDYTIGNEVFGEISEAGEQDWYTFSGTVGQQLYLDSLLSSNNAITPTLYTPSGTSLTWSGGFGEDAYDIFTLEETGTYQLRVDGFGDRTGDYGFRILDVADAEELLLNAPITGNFGSNNRTSRLYQFSGEEGERIFFDTIEGDRNNSYTLYAANGEWLFSQPLTWDKDVVLPKTGDYLLAFAGNGSTNNTYTVEVVAPDSVTAPLSLGQTVTDTISEAGQHNTYTFEGKVGQQLLLDTLISDRFLDANVYAPSGRRIADLDTNLDSSPFTLTEEGTYRLVVDGTSTSGGISSFYTGSYSFILKDVAQAAPLSFDTPITGSLEPGNAVELYQFDGTQGTTLQFDLTANQWDGANWILYDPGNRAIATPAWNSPDFEVVLPSDGAYTVAIQGARSEPVNYSFQATDTTVDAVENAGFGVVERGTIDSSGQVDRYTFTANAGTKVLFDSQDISSSALRFRVVNPDGSYAVNNESVQLDRSPENFKLQQTGEYTVEVYGVNGTGTGNYQFQLLELPKDVSSPSFTPLGVGAVVEGTLNPGRSARAYSFLGEAGQTIYFNGMKGNNVAVRLYAPTGSEVFFVPDVESRDRGSYTLTQEGLYHLVLQGAQNNAADYEFQLLDFDGGEELAFNLSHSGTLQSGLQNKLYQFTGEAGQTLFFDSHTNSSNYWKLYGPDNSLIQERRLQHNFEVTLDRDGTYTLMLGGRFDGPLDYDFTVFSYEEENRVDALVPGTGENSSNDDGSIGSFAVELNVEDSRGGVGVQEYRIRLLPDPENTSPVIISSPKTVYGLNQDFYHYRVQGIDPDNDPLTYRLVEAPLGAVINGDTGELFWFPEDSFPAGESHDFTVEINDRKGGVDRQHFSVNVHEALGEIRGSAFEDLNKNGYRDTVVKGENPYLLFAVDRSASMNAPLERGSETSPVDFLDPHFDLSQIDESTIALSQFQLASIIAFAENLIAQGRGESVNIGFKGLLNPRLVDMDPGTPGFQPFTTLVADNNNNGIPDYREGIANPIFPRPGESVFGNDNGAIAAAIADSLPDNSALNFYFMTDGFIDRPSASVVEELTNNPKINTKYFGIGSGSLLFTNIDPTATQLTSIAQTENILKGWEEKQATEPLLKNVTVYLDLNNNGQLDNDEPWQITTDEVIHDAGATYQYVFDSLLPGEYILRQVAPHGYEQTAPDDGFFVHTVTPDRGGDERYFFGNHHIADPPNRNPVFTSDVPSRSVAAGKPLLHQAIAVDPDSEPLIYDIPLAPEGMVIDPETGVLFWTPTSEQVGNTPVMVRVRDRRGGFALQLFELTVTPPNELPVFTSVLSSNKPQVGKPFQYNAIAIDADDDPITYEWVAAAPSGVTLDPASGGLTWTPTHEQLGEREIILKATDGKGGESTQTLNLTVIEPQPNTAPSITSIPRTVTRVGTPYLYQLAATDPDGDPVTFTLIDSPAGMTVNELGLLSWQPTAAQIGSHAITLTVTDEQGGSATQSYILDVRHQAPNNAPDITSDPLSLTTIDRAYHYHATATDPDGDALFWELIEAPEGMVIDPKTGVVSWQPVPNQVGEQTITARVTDTLGAFSAQTFTLEVRGTNTPPQILSTPPTVIGVEQAYRYLLEATDPERDPLSFSLEAHPDGMTLDAETGEIQWTPQLDQVGSHAVEVLVRDSQGGVGRQTYTLVVSRDAVNQAPTITSTPGFWADTVSGYQYVLEATDPEGDALSFSVLVGPTGLTVDEATGLVQWQPTIAQLGEHPVTLAAFDAAGLGATQTYTLEVTEVNQAPAIRSTPLEVATAQTPYRYDVWASDPEGEPIAYTLVAAPEGMAIDELGRITWSPSTAEIGTYPLEIAVTDSRGAVTTQTYSLAVQADLYAPRVNLSVSEARVDVGNSVTLQVSATDNGGVELVTLAVNGEPVALDNRGLATVELNTVGVIEAVATATDAAGNSGSSRQEIVVIDPTDTAAPFVELVSLAGGNPTPVTALTDIIGTVTDNNLLSYTLSVAPVAGGDFVEIAQGTNPVTDGFLGTFDPSVLQNDRYILRLSATDATGLTAYDETVVDVTGDLKIGNFQLSFTDLSIPVSGIPIQVTRTYDTLTARTTDDFGYGWRLEFRDTDLRTSVGKDEELEEIGIGSKGFSEGERVYITLPGGKREAFTFKPKIKPISRFFPPIGGADTNLYIPAFESESGSTTTLTVKNVDLIRTETGEFASLNGGLYNPANGLYGFGGYYELTTQEGIVYRIDGATGDVETVTDRNGNTLTFTDAGIASSTGQNITFERDARGRIAAVLDPEGNRVTYEYDASGDLVAATDREGNVTRFEYNEERPHYLEAVIDPLGRTGVRSEYDDQGRLVKLFDAEGNPVELVHDPDNSIETVKDQFGNTTLYEYDARGNVLTEVDALGGIVRRTYDGDNNMLSETDPLGNTTTFTYDGNGNVLTETDPLGNLTRYTYDRFGNVLTTTDPTGQTITNTYDSRGNLTQIGGQASGPLTFSYDAFGNLTSMEDGSGSTRFEYDAAGNITRQTDALGNVTTFTYDGNSNRTSETTTQTTPNGVRTLVTEMVYDSEGRVIQTTDAEGGVTRTVYDAVGNRVEAIDALGRSTKYVYDERGQLIKTLYPDSTPGDDSDNPRTRTEYDLAGRAIAEIDELGRRTTFVYDALGRQTATIYPDATPGDDTDNLRTRTEYDAAGRVIAEIDELGNRTQFVYDAAGRVIETILPDETPNDDTDNPRSTSTYDAAGRQLTQTDPLGNVTRFLHDDFGRPIGQDHEDGTTTSVKFDAAGRVVTRTDQAGETTRFEYDALGRLTAVIDALGQRTEYTYDEQGNLVTQKDANGNVTRYEYDGLGRRTATELALGQRSRTSYDAVGNALSTVDFNGDTITYEYDEQNRLILKDLPGDEFDVALTYTANGLRETVTDGRGTTTYSYDEQNRLLERTDPDGRRIAYSYDAAGNRTAVEIPSGTTAYTFDAQNRLKTVTDPDGGVTTYTYNAVGNLVSTDFPNGTVEIREYDDLHRLVYLENRGAGGVINSFRYTLDETGNRTAVEEHDGRRVEYSYDDLYRLTKEAIFDPGATETTRTIEYAYDLVGNRLSREDSGEGVTLYTYDDNDRLLTATTDGVETSYSYDDNGNTVSRTTGSETVSYQWNAENRLVGADTDGDGTVDVENQYDANGIRVSQTVNGEETRFLIDANRPYAQVVEEYTPGGVIKVSYVYGNDLISQNRDEEQSFYHVDGLGSTRALSDESGVGSDQYIYDAFGQVLTRIGDTKNSYLFAGEQRDANVGLDYLRARYLDVGTGRFASRDDFPGFFENPITLHRYLYANANSVNLIDPSGKFAVIEQLSTLGNSSFSRAIFGYQKASSLGQATALALDSFFLLVNFGVAVTAELVLNDLLPNGAKTGVKVIEWKSRLSEPVINKVGLQLFPDIDNTTWTLSFDIKNKKVRINKDSQGVNVQGGVNIDLIPRKTNSSLKIAGIEILDLDISIRGRVPIDNVDVKPDVRLGLTGTFFKLGRLSLNLLNLNDKGLIV